ncbi:MAG: cytochrome c peroxidase, partial [Vicinamibacterales bacterium]
MERPLGFRLRGLQPRRNFPFLAVLGAISLVASIHTRTAVAENDPAGEPDRNLIRILKDAGFTGRIETTLEARLGRPIDPALADLGRLLFFDKILGLHNDNSCAGCLSPAFGFGDSQPMAIGVDSNDVVGPGRF